ncbi:MAG: VacB/RNase II family 3'-5' exoribonuclease [Bacteroidales bacterium]|jgi:ribonuclease R|nr:VacB/RNase II family 3'-5' exoribonuclease [Bacteroidales bacterium]
MKKEKNRYDGRRAGKRSFVADKSEQKGRRHSQRREKKEDPLKKLRKKFSAQVIEEAEKFDERISRKELENRQDFRGVFTCTIDPVDSKDFDDALSVKALGGGRYEIGVHIADVSHFVKVGSAIDAEAYKRATSVYLPDRVIPMLPEHLSNRICSLMPDTDRLTFSVIFTMNENAEIEKYFICKSVIHSQRRFTYNEVQRIIERNKPTGISEENILTLNRLAAIIRKKRFKSGAFNFHSREVRFKLDKKGAPIETYLEDSNESHWLVEEFMLLANKKVTEYAGKRLFIYRIHDEPDKEKLAMFFTFVKTLGFRGKSLNTVFNEVRGRAEEPMLEAIALRSMAKAAYSTNNIGHYGLAFENYTHFTSPIRRYPDIMVHRLLHKYILQPNVSKGNTDALEEECKHCSEMERGAIEAERKAVKEMQVRYMAGRVGEIFDGIVSGVTSWGLYVSLNANYCEGMITLRSLKDDYYELDEANYCLKGRSNGRIFRMGSPLTIRVSKVDKDLSQIDFELVK